MSTSVDSAISLKKESSYGTAVTPDVAYPFVGSPDLAWNPTYAQGTPRFGARVAAAAQRVLVKEEVGGSFTTELTNKGLGKLFEAAFGVGASAQISGAAYQQLFTPLVDDYLPSYTIQLGVAPVGGGDTEPHTFDGMVCSGFELTADNGAIPQIKWNWIGRSFTKDTAFVTPTYPAGLLPFSFVGGKIYSGTITAPGSTTLGSGSDEIANIRSINLAYNNGLDTEGHNFGAAGKRSRKSTVALRDVSGSMAVEYSDNVFRDAFLDQTDVGVVLEFTLPTAITGAHYPTVQIVIPVTRLEGETPKPSLGTPSMINVPFTALDGAVATHPIYAVIVTTETAI